MTNKGKEVRVQVPGKLFVAGEYAVLEGAPAIIAAVNRYLHVTIRPSEHKGYLYSSQNPDLQLSWGRTNQGVTIRGLHPYQLLEQAMCVAEAYAEAQNVSVTAYYDLRIESELDHGESGAKYGLGSSGAVTVAVIKAVLLYFGLTADALTIYKLAIIAQLKLGFKGSFGDLAASSFGGWIAYRRPDRAWLLRQITELSLEKLVDNTWPGLMIQPLQLPAGLQLLVGWTKSAASTEDLVAQMMAQSRQVDKAKAHQQFLVKSQSCLEDLIAAFQVEDLPALQAGIRHNRRLLQTYGQQVGLLIETPELVKLIEIAEQQGAAAKTSGAGGGDCGICLVENDKQAQAVQEMWRRSGVHPLDLQPAPISYYPSEIQTANTR